MYSLTYSSGATKIYGLMRGMDVNATSCEATCASVKAIIAVIGGLFFVAGGSAELNYFRCYATENGNNENADTLPKTGSDIKCEAGTQFPLYLE